MSQRPAQPFVEEDGRRLKTPSTTPRQRLRRLERERWQRIGSPNSKWIAGRPDDSWEAIARQVLALRLHAVRRALPAAAERWQSDVEHVHQLRVATRRAGAALAIAADCLPARKVRRVVRMLRQLRRAAGEARDLDVLQLRWAADESKAALVGTMGLAERITRQRKRAQRPLRRFDSRKWHRKFSRQVARLTRRLHVDSTKRTPRVTLRDQAVTSLSAIAAQFFAASAVESRDLGGLHELRILGKRLRYAMEVFAGAFPLEFRSELYAQVEELQEHLGSVNDHASAIERLCLWSSMAASKQQSDFGRLIDLEQSDLESAKRQFLRTWTPAKRESLKRSFARFLTLAPQAAAS